MESGWNCWTNFCDQFSLNKDSSLTQTSVSSFISWLYEVRKLKHSSIESYLSSISSILKLKNVDPSLFSSYVSKTLLKGGKNREHLFSSPKPSRKVMTLELLKILGHEIATSDWSQDSKRVFWVACCTLFFGSFRAGEIFASSETRFDPHSCLLWEDIKFSENHILVHV